MQSLKGCNLAAENGATYRQFLDHGAEVFSGDEEVKRYEKRVAELERMIGQKEIELALLKNFLGGS